MYYEKNIQTRCLKILEPLVGTENVLVTTDNLNTINLIIVSCLKYLLEQKCENPDLDADALNKQLLTMHRCIVGL